jgi:hypothetical protein
MPEDRELPSPDDLGEGPERRMQNFPPPPPSKEGPLGEPPGPAKPPSADAVGDNDTDELAENMDDATVRLRERDADEAEKRHPEPPPGRSPRRRSRPQRPS